MIITTGFGYYVKNGLKIGKYELPTGQHPTPDGIAFVEVPDRESLDAVVLDQTDEEKDKIQDLTLQTQIQDQRNAFIDALIADDTDAQAAIKKTVSSLKSQQALLSNKMVQ